MKRLLALIGFTCFSVLTAAFYLGVRVAMIIAGASFLLLIVSLCIPKVRKEKTFPASFLTSLLSSVVFLAFTFGNVYPVWNTYNGVSDVVRMTQISDVYHSGSYYCYEMKVERIGEKEVDTKLFLRSKSHLFTDPYDEIIMPLELHETRRSSMLSKGIYLESYVFELPEYEVNSPENKPLRFKIIEMNNNFRRGIYSELPEDAADFSSAVLLGDRNAISDDVNELLRINGLSHISVVSGLHLSIIASLFYKLFGKFVKNRYLQGMFTLGSIWFFAVFSGLGFSVIRAAVLQSVYIFGGMISRRHDSLNSLGAAALLVVIINPYCVGDIGIHLSFLATLGIVLLSEKSVGFIMRKLERKDLFKRDLMYWFTRGVVSGAVTSFSATLFTLPVTIITFGGFSAVAVISNLLTVPFMSVVIVSVALCAVFHYVSFLPLIADTFALVVECYYKYLIFMCKTFAKISFAYVRAEEIYYYLWIAFSLILVAGAVLIKTRKAYMCAGVLSLLILFAGGISYGFSRKDVVTLNIPYTGDGVTVIASNNDSHAVLTLGGNKEKLYVLEKHLDKLTVSEDDVLISTCGKNYKFYEENILGEFDYDTVLLYDNKDEENVREYAELNDDIIYFDDTYTVDLWDRAWLFAESTDSGVYEYMIAGEEEILILTGMLDSQDIPEVYRSPDILITRDVPHNARLLKCGTLVIPGDDYKAVAGAQVLSPIAERIITGLDITIDIDT